tara:strand:+ start:453 stop:698 length:246 start_codon:yes stop_codon:yes gene_type:complete
MQNKEKITVYGTNWCPDCSRSKRLLDSKGLEYMWIDIEQNPDSAEIVRHLNKGLQVVPTIILPGGKVLAEPSNTELEAALG